MKKIFVGNLSWKTTEDQLKSHFETYGPVLSAKIVTDQMTGKSKGFGFVEMGDADSANAAIRELNGKPLVDRALRVSLAQERERSERSDRGGDRGSDRGDRGDRGDRRDSRDSFGNGGRSSHYR